MIPLSLNDRSRNKQEYRIKNTSQRKNFAISTKRLNLIKDFFTMALSTSPVFKGFRGSVNRQLLFKQCGGKTIVTRFPDRSRVVYSENQKREQRRFADAVAFARIVIADKRLFREYSLKASMFNFRSAWNAAIAEYMNKRPLRPKPKKIRFEKTVITAVMGENISVKLYQLEYPRKILTFKSVKEKPTKLRFRLPPEKTGYIWASLSANSFGDVRRS